jgi:Ger(x)C family germination protein
VVTGKLLRKAFILLTLILVPFVSGCWDVQELSQRGIANAVFFDTGDGKRFKMGVVLAVPGTEVPPIVGTEQQFQKRNYVITGEGDSMVDAWTEVQAGTVRNIFFGQTRAIILSEEIARRNINDVLDFIGRIPLLPPNTHVLVAKDDLEELMEMQNRDNYTPGNYIDFYFQTPATRSLAIPVELWRVFSVIDLKEGDPFIPLIQASQEMYLIAGTALFSENRMVGELNKAETETLALLRGTDLGYLIIPLGQNEHAAFFNVRSKTKITPELSPGGALTFNVNIDARGVLVESFPRREIGWQEKKELERAAEREIKKDAENLLAKLQRLNSDPIGFGGKLRINHPRVWEETDWREVYPTARFTVRTTFSVTETGLHR